MTRLDEIRERLAKATKGPWYAVTREGHNWDWVVAKNDRDEICQMFHDGTELNETGEANAQLVAHAPADIEALLTFVESMRKLRYEWLSMQTLKIFPEPYAFARAVEMRLAPLVKEQQ